MAASDGSVKIDILGDASKFKSAVNELGSVASSAMKGIAVGVASASAAIGGIAKQSLSAYSGYEQLTGGVETLFKGSANTVMEYANNAYKTSGLSANQYMETATSFAASLLQGLGGDTEEAARMADLAITDMSDNANKMGTSMSSIQYAYQGFAKQNYTMLDNLKLGYGGTQAEMARLINDSGVLGDTMEVTAKTVNNVSFDKIIEAIHVVQTRMGITGTTAQEAAETIEGSVNSAKAAWENLVTGLGDENANLEQLVQNFVESAKTAAENVVPRLVKIVSGLGKAIQLMAPELTKVIADLVAKTLPTMISAGAQLIAALVSGLISALPTIVAEIPQIVTAIGEAFSANAPTIITAGIELIEVIEQGIERGIPALTQKAVEIIDSLSEGIENNLPNFIAKAAEIILKFAASVTENAGQLIDSGAKLISSIIQGISNSIPQLLLIATKFVPQIATNILMDLGKLVSAGVQIISSLITGIINALPYIAIAVPKIVSSFVNSLTEKKQDIINAGKQMIQTLVDGIKQAVPNISAATKYIIQGIMNFLKEDLPKLVSTGWEICYEIGQGIRELLPDIAQAALEILSTIVQTIIENIPQLWEAADAIIGALAESIEEKFPALTAIFGDLKSAIEGVVIAFAGLRTAMTITTAINSVQGALSALSLMAGSASIAVLGLKAALIAGAAALAFFAGYKIAEFFYNLITGSNEATTSIEAFSSKAKESLSGMYDTGANAGQSLIDGFSDGVEDSSDKAVRVTYKFTAYAKKGFDDLPGTAEGIGRKTAIGLSDAMKSQEPHLKSTTSSMVDTCKKDFSEIPKAAQGIGRESVQNLSSGMRENENGLSGTIHGIVESAKGSLSNMQESFRQIGSFSVDGLIQGIQSKWSSAVSTISRLSQSLVTSSKKLFRINSPSKVFEDEIGAWIPPGISKGVDKAMPKLTADMERDLQGLVKEANEAVSSEVSGFTGKVSLTADARNSTNNEPQNITNDNGIVVNLNYYGTGEPTDIKRISRQIGIEAAKEMRSRGVLA